MVSSMVLGQKYDDNSEKIHRFSSAIDNRVGVMVPTENSAAVVGKGLLRRVFYKSKRPNKNKHATGVRRRATELVLTVMTDAHLGRAVELDQVGPVVESVTESVLRNPDALLGLLRIKNKDDYTFLNSVSVRALRLAFCRSREMDGEIIYQAGLGGLLHDIGMALVPDAILNKQGCLSEEQFEIIKHHPRDGYDIFVKTSGIGEIPLDITLHHYKRHDGSGYPERQSG